MVAGELKEGGCTVASGILNLQMGCLVNGEGVCERWSDDVVDRAPRVETSK